MLSFEETLVAQTDKYFDASAERRGRCFRSSFYHFNGQESISRIGYCCRYFFNSPSLIIIWQIICGTWRDSATQNLTQATCSFLWRRLQTWRVRDNTIIHRIHWRSSTEYHFLKNSIYNNLIRWIFLLKSWV